jgi:hypothetical protein
VQVGDIKGAQGGGYWPARRSNLSAGVAYAALEVRRVAGHNDINSLGFSF